MNPLEPKGDPTPKTWGALWVHAREYGVRVEILHGVAIRDGQKADVAYLCRDDGDEPLHYPIPEGCTPGRPMSDGLMINVCQRLRIRAAKGWTIVL